MTSPIPKISVILPMEDDRGMGLEAITSWINQDCDSDLFELIVVVDNSLEKLQCSYQALLRPNDRLIVHNSHETEQYAVVAELTLGEIIFFTEAHCAATPSAIANAIEYLDTHDADGLCVHTLPRWDNDIGQMESRFYEESFVDWSKPDDWRKVILRGFAIRKASYLEAGGLQYRYHRFAEWLLAATLHEAGMRIDYAPNVQIHHYYAHTTRVLQEHIEDFTQGECQYRLDAPRKLVGRYFGSPLEWERTQYLDGPSVWRAFLYCSRHMLDWHGFTGSWRGRLQCMGQLLGLPLKTVCEEKLALPRAQLGVWRSKIRFRYLPLNSERKYRAFCDFFFGTTAVVRIKAAPRLKVAEPDELRQSIAYNMVEQDCKTIKGFNAPESQGNTSFRWSRAISTIKFPLMSGQYKVEIILLPNRPINVARELSIYFARQPVDGLSYNSQRHSLLFTIENSQAGSDALWLDILCRPLRSKTDDRQLGLPIASITAVRN